MESLNCNVKELFDFHGWKNFLCFPPPKVYKSIVKIFYANLCSNKPDKLETLVLGNTLCWTVPCLTLSIDQTKMCTAKSPSDSLSSQLGPGNVCFETHVLAHMWKSLFSQE